MAHSTDGRKLSPVFAEYLKLYLSTIDDIYDYKENSALYKPDLDYLLDQEHDISIGALTRRKELLKYIYFWVLALSYKDDFLRDIKSTIDEIRREILTYAEVDPVWCEDCYITYDYS